MSFKSCKTCRVNMLKKPKQTYKSWTTQKFCSFDCRNESYRIKDPEAHFWSKVDKQDSCWLYNGYLQRGYGYFNTNKKNWLAHRYAWTITKGPLDNSLELDHLCRTRNCVNPSHLEEVTPLENKKRSPLWTGNRTHCSKGHEFVESNIYKRPEGGRGCRICRREYTRRWYARQNQLNTI